MSSSISVDRTASRQNRRIIFFHKISADPDRMNTEHSLNIGNDESNIVF